MAQPQIKERPAEWACRVILTVHFLLVLAGYVNYIQIKHQLTTPIIPKSTIEMIASPYWKISLGEGVFFLISLWFYFLRWRIAALIVSSISVISYWVITNYFLDLIN